MKVFNTFRTKVTLLSDFGVEKIEKMENDFPTIKNRRVVTGAKYGWTWYKIIE